MSQKINKALTLFYNAVINKIPSRHFRLFFLRLLGAKIGRSFVCRNTVISGPAGLKIGNGSSIGWHCLLDARGGIDIADDVNISSYVKIITAGHDIHSPSFESTKGKVYVESKAWLATGCTILEGVKIGFGAVVAAGAVVTKDVPPFAVVGGVPAKKIAERVSNLDYQLYLPPILY